MQLAHPVPLCLVMGLRIPASLCFPQSCMNYVPFHSCQGHFVLSLSITIMTLSGLFNNYDIEWLV